MSALEKKVKELNSKLTASNKKTEALFDLLYLLQKLFPWLKSILARFVKTSTIPFDEVDKYLSCTKNSSRRNIAEAMNIASKTESTKPSAKTHSSSSVDANNEEEADEIPLARVNNTVMTFSKDRLKDNHELVNNKLKNGTRIQEIIKECMPAGGFCFELPSFDDNQDTKKQADEAAAAIIESFKCLNAVIVSENTGVEIKTPNGEVQKLHSKGVLRHKVLNCSTIENGSLVIIDEYKYINPNCEMDGSTSETVSFNSLTLSGSKLIYRYDCPDMANSHLLNIDDADLNNSANGVTPEMRDQARDGVALLKKQIRIRRDNDIKFFKKLSRAIRVQSPSDIRAVIQQIIKARREEILNFGRLESAYIQPASPLSLHKGPAHTMLYGGTDGLINADYDSQLFQFISPWFRCGYSTKFITSLCTAFIGFNTSKNAVHNFFKQQHQCTGAQSTSVNLINAFCTVLGLCTKASLDIIRSSNLIIADEVTMKQMEESQAIVKYMYSLMNGRDSDERHVCITYTGSREFKHILSLLKPESTGFKAALIHSDGYIGYKKFIRYCYKKKGLIHVTCIVHARRFVMRYLKDSLLLDVYTSILEKAAETEADVFDLIDEYAATNGNLGEIDVRFLKFIHLISMLFAMENRFLSCNTSKSENRFSDPDFMNRLANARIDHYSIIFFLADSIVCELADKFGMAQITRDRDSYKVPDNFTHPGCRAVVYWMNHRNTLVRFLEHPEVELSTNVIERMHRRVVVSYNHFHFMRTPGGSAAFAHLVTALQNCAMAGVNFSDFLDYVMYEYIKARNQIYMDPDLMDKINSDYRERSGINDFDIRDYLWMMPSKCTLTYTDKETGAEIKVEKDLNDELNPTTFMLGYIDSKPFNPYVFKKHILRNDWLYWESDQVSDEQDVYEKTSAISHPATGDAQSVNAAKQSPPATRDAPSVQVASHSPQAAGYASSVSGASQSMPATGDAQSVNAAKQSSPATWDAPSVQGASNSPQAAGYASSVSGASQSMPATGDAQSVNCSSQSPPATLDAPSVQGASNSPQAAGYAPSVIGASQSMTATGAAQSDNCSSQSPPATLDAPSVQGDLHLQLATRDALLSQSPPYTEDNTSGQPSSQSPPDLKAADKHFTASSGQYIEEHKRIKKAHTSERDMGKYNHLSKRLR